MLYWNGLLGALLCACLLNGYLHRSEYLQGMKKIKDSKKWDKQIRSLFHRDIQTFLKLLWRDGAFPLSEWAIHYWNYNPDLFRQRYYWLTLILTTGGKATIYHRESRDSCPFCRNSASHICMTHLFYWPNKSIQMFKECNLPVLLLWKCWSKVCIPCSVFLTQSITDLSL